MRRILLILLLALPAGCFRPVRAPSLAPRAIEGEAVLAPTEALEPPLPAPPVLQPALDAQVAAAMAGDAAFVAEQARAARAVAAARGTAPGSEAWTTAQQALTALDAALAPARDAAGMVDALRGDPANAGSGARAAVAAAAARIAAIADRERAAVAALARELR